jgi:YaiO family outer membrane protein
MRFSLLPPQRAQSARWGPRLLALLLVIAPAGTALAQTAAEASQLADEGRDAEALAAFRQIAARNPNDLEARLWIARLHDRMGNLDQAESVYHSVLLEDPARVEAALGVAAALLARDEPEEAIELLEPIEEREPQNGTALALLGRAHRQAGRTEQAIGYFERAMAAAPTDEYRLRLADARLSHHHRVELRGFGEQFGGPTPDSRGGDLTVNYRLSERLRVIARGQAQRKFSVSEQRGGAGVEWKWRPSTTLRAQLLMGPGNLVMPEGDFLAEADYTYGPAVWTASLRYFDFTGARTTFLSPAVTFPVSDRISAALRYAFSWTETSRSAGVDLGHTVQLRGAYRLRRRVSLQVGIAAGVEDFETFSIDRIGDFRATTASGGVRLDLRTLTALVASYDRQQRRGSLDMSRVNVVIQHRF